MICGEDVENGKPDPEGYLKAANLLGVEPTKCVVFEDAPAGISAAERMGANVVVISTTHSHPIETDHLTIDSYDELDIAVTETGALRLDRASVTAR
ncbi:Phosphorylated carbohydrates phosphatase [compost metagenome]